MQKYSKKLEFLTGVSLEKLQGVTPLWGDWGLPWHWRNFAWLVLCSNITFSVCVWISHFLGSTAAMLDLIRCAMLTTQSTSKCCAAAHWEWLPSNQCVCVCPLQATKPTCTQRWIFLKLRRTARKKAEKLSGHQNHCLSICSAEFYIWRTELGICKNCEWIYFLMWKYKQMEESHVVRNTHQNALYVLTTLHMSFHFYNRLYFIM